MEEEYEPRFSKKKILAAAIIILLIISVIIGVRLVQTRQEIRSRASSLEANTVPRTVFLAQSDKQTAPVGDIVRVKILARSDIDPANLFIAKVDFPADKLELVNIDLKEGVSFVKNWIEKTVNQDLSTVKLVGMVPSPGLKTEASSSAVLMAELVFKTLKTGQALAGIEGASSAIYSNIDNKNIFFGLTEGSIAKIDVVNEAPAAVLPATFVIRSDNNVVKTGQQVKVSLIARSDSAPANLFEAKIAFPSDLLEVKSIDSKDGVSFIKSWVDKSFDNSAGTIHINGGVLNPGYQSQANQDSIMADIIFTAKKAGTANLSFTGESGIYRNSDNVNVFQDSGNTVINILNHEVTITPVSTITPTPTVRVMVSPTPTAKLTSTPTLIQATATPTPAVQSGDLNGDNKVSSVDLSILFSNWGKSGTAVGKADINKDGVVNAFDFGILKQFFNK